MTPISSLQCYDIGVIFILQHSKKALLLKI